MSFIVGFVTSVYTLSSNGKFSFFQTECLWQPCHNQIFAQIEEYSNPDCSFQKGTPRFDRKIVELKCLIKEKVGRIALNKGPIISLTKKGDTKKQSPRVLQFLIKDTIA